MIRNITFLCLLGTLLVSCAKLGKSASTQTVSPPNTVPSSIAERTPTSTDDLIPIEDTWDIYLANLTDGTYKQITQGEIDYIQPHFSPDGKYISYIRNSEPKTLFIYDLNTGQASSVFSLNSINYTVWSRNAKKLAFVGFDNSTYSLYTYDTEDSETTVIYESKEEITFPTWSPRGDEIGFSTGLLEYNDDYSVKNDEREVYIINIATRELRQVTFTEEGGAIAPSWSPTENKIVYIHQANPTYAAETVILNLDNQSGLSVKRWAAPNYPPVWSEDGQAIAIGYCGGVQLINKTGQPIAEGGSFTNCMIAKAILTASGDILVDGSSCCLTGAKNYIVNPTSAETGIPPKEMWNIGFPPIITESDHYQTFESKNADWLSNTDLIVYQGHIYGWR